MKRYHMSYKSNFNDDIDFNVAFKQFLAKNVIDEDDVFSIVYLGHTSSGFVAYDVFVRGE